MIVVLVGTSPYTFERAIKVIDCLAREKDWQVFIQIGYTQYKPEHCEYKPFLPKEKIIEKIEAAEVVVCHGGFGSIRDALACGKAPVVIPRLEVHGECLHEQDELIRPLVECGRILAVEDLDDLFGTIEKARSFTPTAGLKSNIPEIIQSFIDAI